MTISSKRNNRHAVLIGCDYLMLHTRSSVALHHLPTQERLWNIESPSFNFAFDSQNSVIVLSPEENTSHLETSLVIWDVHTGSIRHHLTYTRDGLPYEVSPGGLALSPDGHILAAGMESELEALVVLWDITDGRFLRTLKTGDNDDITRIAFHPSDNFLVGGSFNNRKVWFWDLDDGHLFNTWEPGCNDRPHNLAFNPDGTILFAGYGFYGLYGWDVKQMKEISKPKGDLWANRISIAPDGLSLAIGHFGPVGLRTVQILEMNTWRVLHEFSGDSDIFTGSFSSDGRLLTTMELYGDVSIWNVASGELQYSL